MELERTIVDAIVILQKAFSQMCFPSRNIERKKNKKYPYNVLTACMLTGNGGIPVAVVVPVPNMGGISMPIGLHDRNIIPGAIIR